MDKPRSIISILVAVIVSLTGLVCVGLAAKAFYKADVKADVNHAQPVDLLQIVSIGAAAMGTVFMVFAFVLIFRHLQKSPPPPPDSHF